MYAYVGGDPVNYVDPYGLLSDAAFRGGGIGGSPGGSSGAIGGLGGGAAKGAAGVVGFGLGAWGAYQIWDGYGSESSDAGASGDTTKPEQCTDKPCPPCKTVSGKIVPVGTIGYRPMDTPSKPQHGIVGPHYNIYRANQYPAPKCDCFWQLIGAVPPAGLPASAIPIEPFAN